MTEAVQKTMSRRLVAVALRDDGTVSPHAGRALVWLVYDVQDGAEPQEAYSITLTAYGSLHEWHMMAQPERHPLHAVDVAIAGSCGDGVIRNLAARQTELVLTSETDPLRAVHHYLEGCLPAGLPHEETDCLGDGKKRPQ